MTLEEQLLRDEGRRQSLTGTASGKPPLKSAEILMNVGISQDEAMILLANDIDNASACLRTHLQWTIDLDDIRRAAIVNMCFNMGIGGQLGFRKFLAAP